jgi:hypothetical protein
MIIIGVLALGIVVGIFGVWLCFVTATRYH